MPFYKFEKNDVFRNQIKTYPSVTFFTYTGSVFYNNRIAESGSHSYDISGIPIAAPSSSWSGSVSLFDLNIDRPSTSKINAFLYKDGSKVAFKTTSQNTFASANPGDQFTKNYPLSASITNLFTASIAQSDPSRTGSANIFTSLVQPMKKYLILNPRFQFSSSLHGDRGREEARIIDVPSIYYGSSIKKGSVSLKFLINGTASQTVTDYYKDGTLRVTGSDTNEGDVAGLVLYDEGIFLLTGSWNITEDFQDDYNEDETLEYPRWTYFGVTSSATTGSSFELAFSGTNYVPVVTMLAHAPKGELNQSNNPTFVKYGQTPDSTLAFTGSRAYRENKSLEIKNTTKSNLTGALVSASFEKTTYISKIGIYDENKQLLGIAKLATPVRKREIDEFTFKLKLDF